MDPTLDRSPEVLVDEQIGRTRYLTPEGFLFCEGARVARVGPMLYRHDEVPDIEPAGPGMITITRDADVLFSEETISSFVGKPVTNNHPPDFVKPETFRTYCVGVTLNPRRGEGIEADYLIADLLITDQDAISAVLASKRELSPGYSAPREQVRPGLGRQTQIIGNHVALVERGRGGPACAIQDGLPDDPVSKQEEAGMAKKRSVWDRLTTAFKANDEAAFNEELEAAKDELAGDEPQKIVIEVKQPDAATAEPEKAEDEGEAADPMAEIKTMLADIGARLAKLESGEAAEETADEDAEEKKDEEAAEPVTMDAFADARARAEILNPGVKLPTFDAKADAKSSRNALHDLRVRALTGALGDQARKGHVEAILSGRKAEFGSMTADSVATIFVGASELAKAFNRPNGRPSTFPQGPMTAAKYAEMIKSRRATA
jgi:hypothetical protein